MCYLVDHPEHPYYTTYMIRDRTDQHTLVSFSSSMLGQDFISEIAVPHELVHSSQSSVELASTRGFPHF